MNLIRSCMVAFSMYSKIPMPRVEWTKESMKYAICFFPLIGIVIGLLCTGWSMAADMGKLGNTFTTAVMILIPVAVTGGIHLDGLLDTADALSSYKTQEEKLEILKDSHAGAFAIIVGICYFILCFGIWSEAHVRAVQVLGVGFILSRALSGLALVSFRMAKNTGLAATFSDMALKSRVRVVMAIYILGASGLMILLEPISGTMGVMGAILTFFAYRHMAYQKFGGITGDLAGFFLQICELVMALCVILTEILI